jgi:predicted kinase
MAFIFLDESGDLGFNPKKKSSKYFVITILATSNKKPIEKIVKKIHSTLKKKVRKLSGGILHAYKEKPATRKRMLKLISKKDCTVMSIYLNKSKVYTHLQEEKHVLYNYVTNILLDRIMKKRLVDSSDIVYIVASKRETNKFFNDNFKNYLKSQISNKHKIKVEIEIKTPSEEKSLQVVDFVSWAIFRKHEYGDDSYYKLIKSRIVEENPLFS